MRSVTVVMPYVNRQYQLNKTLESLAKSKHDNFNVVIMDDFSQEEVVFPDYTPFPINVLRHTEKQHYIAVWNRAIQWAIQLWSPDAIFLQSPECMHCGDVLMDVEQRLTDDNYLAYGCFQIDKDTTFSEGIDILDLSRKCNYKVTANPHGNGQNAWWNHSVYEPQPQYWGCAITTKNLIKVNGIDERFAEGYAIEDGYFIWQIRKMGLNIEIIDYPFVVHQWHERVYPPNVREKVQRNKDLYSSLILQDDYRSVHTITPDLK